jgi:hypothetical protein
MVLCVWPSNVPDFEKDWITFLLPEDTIIINEIEKINKYPNTPCIFITNYWIDFIPLIKDIKHIFGIIYLGEEILSDKNDYFINNPLCQFIWRNYIHPKYINNPIVKFFPCAFKKDFCNYTSEFDKEYLWSFAGSIHDHNRQEPIDLYKEKLPLSYKLHITPPLTFNAPEGLPTKEYRELIQKSKYVLCPPGKIMIECSRIYETLEAGSIPITIVNKSEHYDYKPSYYHFVFPKKFGYLPFIIAENWEETIDIVNKIENTNQYNDILNECKNYWNNCKDYWKKKLALDIHKLNKPRFTWKQILDAPSFIINLQRKPLLLSRSIKRAIDAGYTNVNHHVAVDGLNDNLPKVEKDWLSPLSPYAASKLAAESLILAFRESYGLPISIYRLFNVYGPHQTSESVYAAVLPKWIFAAFNNQPLVVFGDGEQKRDFTFVDDVISVFEKSIKNNHNIDYPINLAFGKPVTLNQILQIFKKYFGKIKVDYRDVRKGDIRDSESNPASLMNLHDHKLSQTPLESGLVSTFEWFKINYNF